MVVGWSILGIILPLSVFIEFLDIDKSHRLLTSESAHVQNGECDQCRFPRMHTPTCTVMCNIYCIESAHEFDHTYTFPGIMGTEKWNAILCVYVHVHELTIVQWQYILPGTIYSGIEWRWDICAMGKNGFFRQEAAAMVYD